MGYDIGRLRTIIYNCLLLLSRRRSAWLYKKFFENRVVLWYTEEKGGVTVTTRDRRMIAVKTADAINAIEGVPVSPFAKQLSSQWIQGELTGEQMKNSLLATHRKIAELERYRHG